MDKNQAMVEYLLGCDQIKNNPLFFNFLNAQGDNKQFLTQGNDKKLNRTYIDGSELKRYTFTIVDYREVAYQAVVKQAGYPNENMEELLDVQGIIDWITEQNELRNFPNFGTGYQIEEIRTLTDTPTLNGVDSNLATPLAKYSISIQVDYLDYTHRIWK